MSWQDINNAATSLDRLVLFEQEMMQAHAAGVVEGLPASMPGQNNITQLKQIEPVLRDRLIRLGYLDELARDEQARAVIEGAVRQLQADAGLTVDGWIGVQSWAALQELFTFENASNLHKWALRQPNAFVWRAVELRLITLGLLPGRKNASGKPFKQTWQHWRQLCAQLELADAASDDSRLISVLFDIDGLTKTVHRQTPQIRALCATSTAEGKRLQDFVSCLLKIELWLHGYQHIKPDGKPLILERVQRRHTRTRSYHYTDDYSAVRKFWRDVGANTRHAENITMLLRSFSYLLDDSTNSLSAQQEKGQMIEQLSQHMAADLGASQQEWQRQGWGAWLWDGLKRVFKAITNWFRQLGQKIKDTLRLVIRSAKQLVSESFSFVRRTFHIIEDGFALYFNPTIRGSNQLVSMSHDKDCDFRVFVSANATKADVQQLTRPLQKQLLRFKAALRLTRLLTKILTGALSIATLGWSWWRLIKVLLGFNRLLSTEDIDILRRAYADV